MKFRIFFLIFISILLFTCPLWADSTIVYVDADATGANDGTSWEDAFTDFQSALDVAEAEDRIWVAEGVYKPSVMHGGTEDRHKSFQMIDGVKVKI